MTRNIDTNWRSGITSSISTELILNDLLIWPVTKKLVWGKIGPAGVDQNWSYTGPFLASKIGPGQTRAAKLISGLVAQYKLWGVANVIPESTKLSYLAIMQLCSLATASCAELSYSYSRRSMYRLCCR